MIKQASHSKYRILVVVCACISVIALFNACDIYRGDDGSSFGYADSPIDRSLLAQVITIDGNASDWASIPPIVTETGQSALSLSVTHDDIYLYFCVKGKKMGPNYGLYLNTDNNASTGYQGSPWGSAGLDYLIENGTLYRSLGPGWNWQNLGRSSVRSAANANVVEVSVKRSALQGLANKITLGSIDIASNWTTKSLLPKNPPLPQYIIVPGQDPAMNILVPAYFYPGQYWDTLAARAALMPGRITAIANPGSGPGSIVDPNYQAAINNMRNAGGRVIGYVYTIYGTRPINEVKVDIDLWYQFYSIDGIFLDQQANTAGREPFYLELYQYIKSKQASSIVVGNPGTATVETYLFYQGNRVTDVLCIFEMNTGFLTWQPPLWCSNYPSGNFCVIPFNTPVSLYQAYVDHAASQNAGWVYCTDDDLPNPWDTLPVYFGELCDYVKSAH